VIKTLCETLVCLQSLFKFSYRKHIKSILIFISHTKFNFNFLKAQQNKSWAVSSCLKINYRVYLRNFIYWQKLLRFRQPVGMEENYSLFTTNIQDWPTNSFVFSNTANWLFSPPFPITPLARAISHIKLRNISNVITGESKRFGSFPFHKKLWCLYFFQCFHRDKYARRWNGLCFQHIFVLTSHKYQLGYFTVIRWSQNYVLIILTCNKKRALEEAIDLYDRIRIE